MTNGTPIDAPSATRTATTGDGAIPIAIGNQHGGGGGVTGDGRDRSAGNTRQSINRLRGSAPQFTAAASADASPECSKRLPSVRPPAMSSNVSQGIFARSRPSSSPAAKSTNAAASPTSAAG